MMSEKKARKVLEEHGGFYTVDEEGDGRYIVHNGAFKGYGFSLTVAVEHMLRNAGLLPPASASSAGPPPALRSKSTTSRRISS